MLLSSMACTAGPLPGPGSAHACPTNCSRPQRSATAPHRSALSHFSLAYFDARSMGSSSNTDVVLVAQTDHGRISVLRPGLAPPVMPVHREARSSGAGASRTSSISYGDSITPDAHQSPDSRRRHGQLRDAAASPLSGAKAAYFKSQERLEARGGLTFCSRACTGQDIDQLSHGMPRSVCRFAPPQLSTQCHHRLTQGR